MSVGFDVSANTQSAQNALKQLQDAFRQLQREGQKFTEIDLSQIGTEQLKRDLQTIIDNWKRMTQASTGGSRGAAIRGSGQADRAPWDVDLRQSHPNANDAQIKRIQQELIESLLRGISGNHPDLPRPPPPRLDIPTGGQARDEEARKRREAADQHRQDNEDRRAKREQDRAAAAEEQDSQRRRQQITGSVMGGVKFTAGMMGLQTGLDAIQGAYRGATDIGKYTDEFMRRTHDIGNDFSFLREQITGVGRHLGVVSDESAKLTLAFTRTAYAATVEEARAGTQAAVGMAAGFGADKDQTVQQMARMSLIGAAGNGALSTTHKKFALLIGQTVGQHNIPLEKGLADFSRLAESSAARTGQAPPSESIASYLKSLYDVAHTSRPGLRGESGASLLGAADEGFKNADNPAVNVLMFRALSKQMGTQNWLEIQEQKEKGAFASVGKDGETNFGAFFKEIKKQFGGLDKNYTAYALNNALGLGGIGRAKALIEIEENRKEQGGVDGYQKDLAKRGIDLEKLDESGIKDLGDIFKSGHSADQFNAAKTKWKDGNLDTAKPLTEEEKGRLQGLQTAAIVSGKKEDQDAFVNELAKTIANHGMKATPYSQMENELAQIKSAMIDKVGGPIVDGLSYIAAILQKGFGVTPEHAEAEKKYTESQKSIAELSRTSDEELVKAKGEMEAARGTAAFPEKVQAYQDAARRTRDQYRGIAKDRDQAYRDSGVFNFIPAQAPGESNLYGALKEGKDQRQKEIEKLETELDRLNLNPLDKEWWTSTEEQREQRSKEREQQAPEIQKQLDALKAQKDIPVRRASGGVIPGGVGGGDRVKAALTPGEFVVNAYAAQRHQPLLNQINSGGSAPSDGETPAAVHDLQKRLEQLFDPVTRYLSELAAGARALSAGQSGGGPGAGVGGYGSGSGTGTAGSTATGSNEETHPLIRAALNKQSAAGLVTGSAISSRRFSGDGLGFLSKGFVSGRGSRRGAGGPPASDHDAPRVSAQTARSSRHSGTDRLDIPPSAQAVKGGSADSPTPSAKTVRGKSSKGVSDSQAEFVRKYRPAAEKAAAELGVSADTLLAQAAHETAWGKSRPRFADGRDSNNMFGIKANRSWQGERVNARTGEHINGRDVTITDGFRAYDSPESSFNDYAKFIKENKRYKKAVEKGKQGDDKGYLEEIHRAGYATDPNYASKVERNKRMLEKVRGNTPQPPAPATNSENDHRAGTAAMTKAVIDQQKATPTAEQAKTKAKAKISETHADKVAKAAMAADKDDHRAYTDAVTKTVMEQQAANKKDTGFYRQKTGDGLGDGSFHLLKRTDEQDTIPKPQTPEFTPKPKEAAIPEPKRDQASAGQGIGHLNITLTQADASGAKVGADVNHRMNLRTSQPHGAISVATANKTA